MSTPIFDNVRTCLIWKRFLHLFNAYLWLEIDLRKSAKYTVRLAGRIRLSKTKWQTQIFPRHQRQNRLERK